MSAVDFREHGRAQEPFGTAFRRIGQIAGLLTIATVIFATLYVWVLYLASE